MEPHPRLAAPDTPPELVSPTSSSYSSRPSPPADTWKSATIPISPPLTSYDRRSVSTMSSTGKSIDEGQARRETSQPSFTTKLPPLSSLFPHPPARPLPSPQELHGSFASVPILERPPRVPSAHGDRLLYSGPYAGEATVTSHPSTQPRSTYEPRYDSERTPSLHSLTRSLSGPNSPRHDHLRAEPLRFDSAPAPTWSRAHEPRRHEYSLGGREVPPLPSPPTRPSLSYPGSRDLTPSFTHDPRASHLPPTSVPSLPGNPTTAEGVPVKDGLGPKIWTGTHFLPRFVCAAEVPGEGMCYFYDDGSHCKTVIDGEAVNAHWGVTKAGKPRKRLAIACVTCREKKIKCDPDYPRCLQCEKFGRVCKFKNA